MDEPGFSSLLLVVVVAFAAPFLLGLAPWLRLPSVVFEIVAGIVIGPSVLGWVELDQTSRWASPAAAAPSCSRVAESPRYADRGS